MTASSHEKEALKSHATQGTADSGTIHRMVAKSKKKDESRAYSSPLPLYEGRSHNVDPNVKERRRQSITRIVEGRKQLQEQIKQENMSKLP